MDQYRQAELQEMNIELAKDAMAKMRKNIIEKARLGAMNKANQDFRTNEKVPRKDAFGNIIYFHQKDKAFNDGHRYDLD